MSGKYRCLQFYIRKQPNDPKKINFLVDYALYWICLADFIKASLLSPNISKMSENALENAAQNRHSKTCSVLISQYSADGSSGKVILALYLCRMISALTPYIPVYRCLGFVCNGSFQNFDILGRVSLYFLL